MVLRRASRAMEEESMIEWMDDGVGDLLFLALTVVAVLVVLISVTLANHVKYLMVEVKNLAGHPNTSDVE